MDRPDPAAVQWRCRLLAGLPLVTTSDCVPVILSSHKGGGGGRGDHREHSSAQGRSRVALIDFMKVVDETHLTDLRKYCKP